MMEKLIELLHEKEERSRLKYPYVFIGYNGVILPEPPKCWNTDAPKDGE